MARGYETQLVRDLVWALTSPPLLFHRVVVRPERARRDVDRYEGILRQFDNPGSDLAREVRRRQSSRLGEYFETLLTTWIGGLPPARLLGSNVQVHGDAGTVGEYDLVFEQDRTTHHWELAIKFYLGYPEKDGPRWYGPNPVDVLHQKWKKMRKHQLRLSEHPLGRRALRRMGASRRVQPAAFIKGYLYEALDPQFATHHHPHANRDGLRGWWVHRSGLDTFAPPAEEGVSWIRLSKLRWMSPARPSDDDRLSPDVRTLARNGVGEMPIHVAGVVETDDGWREVSRGFIVPDGWPG